MLLVDLSHTESAYATAHIASVELVRIVVIARALSFQQLTRPAAVRPRRIAFA